MAQGYFQPEGVLKDQWLIRRRARTEEGSGEWLGVRGSDSLLHAEGEP